jgi:hypothetical protein
VPTDSVGRPRRPPPAAPGSLRVEPRPSSMAGKPKRRSRGSAQLCGSCVRPGGPSRPRQPVRRVKVPAPSSLTRTQRATNRRVSLRGEGLTRRVLADVRSTVRRCRLRAGWEPATRRWVPTTCRVGPAYESGGADCRPVGAGCSSANSSSVSRRERIRKRTPSGASTLKPAPRPGTTSMVRCVCDQ